MLGVDSALPETLCELGQASRHSLSHPPQPGWCLCGKDFKSSCQTPEWERQRVLATMHSSHSLLALLLPLLLLLVAITGPAGALSDDEKHVMVKLHNLYRAQVSPPAADMLQMVSVARDACLPELKGCWAGAPTNAFRHQAEAISETHLSSII